MSTEDRALRDHLAGLFFSENAHANIDSALKDFPFELTGTKPPNAPHSAWQLLEHLRLTVHDLLEFSTNSEYLEPKWPDDYWPKTEAPKDREEWDASVAAFRADSEAMGKLASDFKSNLYAQIPWGSGQTLLREILVAADHSSYHLGQIVYLRKLLGAWQ